MQRKGDESRLILKGESTGIQRSMLKKYITSLTHKSTGINCNREQKKMKWKMEAGGTKGNRARNIVFKYY